MSTRVPAYVSVASSQVTYRRSRNAVIAFSALFLIFMVAGDSWFPLVAIPAIALPWLAVMRFARAGADFTPENVLVRGTYRTADVAVDSISDIVLSARPGICYLRAADGGSVVATIGALAFEANAERRARLHDLEMLQRLYRKMPIRLYDSNDTGTAAINRSSGTVRLVWIRPAAREVLFVVGVCVMGVVCFIW